MPVSGWNGKLEGVGNGGFAGSINYGLQGGMAAALLGGYATASTDTGHKAGAMVDASWALGHPEKIVDFGYRAIHLTAENAKADRASLLWRQFAAILFPWLLQWRTSGVDGSAALSE